MKYKNFIYWLILILGIFHCELQAQEAVVAAGGDGTGSGGSISLSVGQIGTTTSIGTNGNSVAEGVQQPFEISIVTGIENGTEVQIECFAYPNPLKDHLTLKIDASTINSYESMEFHLYDLNGVLLENKKLDGAETFISMTKYAPATYLLRITESQKEIKIFKIIKIKYYEK